MRWRFRPPDPTAPGFAGPSQQKAGTDTRGFIVQLGYTLDSPLLPVYASRPPCQHPIPFTDAGWGFSSLLNAGRGTGLGWCYAGRGIGIIASLAGDGEQQPPALLWQGWETRIPLSLLTTWPWGQSPGPWAGGRWKVSCPLTTLEPQVWDSGVRSVCPERTPSPGPSAGRAGNPSAARWGSQSRPPQPYPGHVAGDKDTRDPALGPQQPAVLIALSLFLVSCV